MYINITNICKENKIKQIFLDTYYVNYLFYSEFKRAEIEIIKISDPIISAKAVKNETEISGAKAAHKIDSF